MNSQRPLLMNFAIPSNVTSSNNCTGFSFSPSVASPFLIPMPADTFNLSRNFSRTFKLTIKNRKEKKKTTFNSFIYNIKVNKQIKILL